MSNQMQQLLEQQQAILQQQQTILQQQQFWHQQQQLQMQPAPMQSFQMQSAPMRPALSEDELAEKIAAKVFVNFVKVIGGQNPQLENRESARPRESNRQPRESQFLRMSIVDSPNGNQQLRESDLDDLFDEMENCSQKQDQQQSKMHLSRRPNESYRKQRDPEITRPSKQISLNFTPQETPQQETPQQKTKSEQYEETLLKYNRMSPEEQKKYLNNLSSKQTVKKHEKVVILSPKK